MWYAIIELNKMKTLILIIPLIGLLSCASKPESPQPVAAPPIVAEAPPAEPVPEPVAAPVEEVFDPATVTVQEYTVTKAEIERFVTALNGIVKAGNYNGWLAYLAKAYIDEISSPEFLDRMSKTAPRLVSQKIVLKSAQDYFNHVIVPSRANSRVDDIEFVTHTRVKAITENRITKERLRLYELERIDDLWKIVN
ncbi:putative lipoprotein [Treponema primitia ZAS-2]|uniref:Putative lipoprotein n=2 Tax=Treponema primitia TaxID=88058 RepID=F5YR44_TREPZ|nr:putative lipoprotein [Treponema primitia ZAS-2]